MVDQPKAISLISSLDHCQRSSPSRISNTPRAEFEPVQNLSSGLVEWICAVVITTTPHRHNVRFCFLWSLFVLLFFLFYYFKWHPYNPLNEQSFTHSLNITAVNSRHVSRKKYLLKCIFSKGATMINTLLHGAKIGHTLKESWKLKANSCRFVKHLWTFVTRIHCRV